jgi:hypothetical protein
MMRASIPPLPSGEGRGWGLTAELSAHGKAPTPTLDQRHVTLIDLKGRG